MEFHRITEAADPHFESAFAVYQTSFPSHERRNVEKQRALLSCPLYHFDVVLEEGVFAGLLLHWDFANYTYVEHYAILSTLRGQSLGSACLQSFCKKYPLVILEIDPPGDEISVRRQGFYARLGFQSNVFAHAHPAYHRQNLPHELVVMSYPRTLSGEEYAVFCGELRDIVMADAEN